MSFLESQNQMATHFLIGSNIIWYPEAFQTTFNSGHDICVHTWTHPLMTTKTNLEVVAEVRGPVENYACTSSFISAHIVGLDDGANSQLHGRAHPKILAGALSLHSFNDYVLI